MTGLTRACLVAFMSFAFSSSHARSAGHKITLKIQGSSTVNPIVAEAAERFRGDKGWRIFVDTQGGSSGGIAGVAEGLVDLGMSSKPIGEEDVRKFPNADFRPTVIGVDGVALVVSAPVWSGGVRSLSKDQVQKIYAGDVRNWRDVGGPDSRIVFYNKEPGRGTWSVFAHWAYGDSKNAPLISHPEVGGNEETRNKVSFHPSAISQLSFAWANGSDKIRALGIRMAKDDIVYPTIESIKTGVYPMTRRLYLVTAGEAQRDVREFIDYLLSESGQELVAKHGYIPVN